MDHSDIHPGFPQRPPASALLCIDSEDRYANGQIDSSIAIRNKLFSAAANPGNQFSIQKSQPLLYGIFKRVGMTQIQLQYRVPTIVEGVNDTFFLDVSGTAPPFEIILDAGYYSATTLAAEIQAKVLALAGTPIPGFTCVYDPQYGGFTMAQGAGTVQFSFIAAPPGDPLLAVVNRTLITIGAQAGNLDFATTQFLGTPQLLFTRYVDIVSSRLSKFQRVKDADTLATNKTNILTRVYLTPPGQRSDPSTTSGPLDICVDPNTPKHSMWSTDEAIYELDFTLYDEYGQVLYWSPEYNTEFQITLLASET